MEAKEFRKGNYVQDVVSGEWMIIDEIGENIGAVIINRDKYPLPYGWQMGPIPLTPELLEKIGGKNKGGWVGYFYEAEVYGEDVRIVWQLMDGRLSIFANENLIKHEDSPTVHSFQNSVYFLTGEELKIEL